MNSYGGVYCGDDEAFDQDVPLNIQRVIHVWEGNKKEKDKQVLLEFPVNVISRPKSTFHPSQPSIYSKATNF